MMRGQSLPSNLYWIKDFLQIPNPASQVGRQTRNRTMAVVLNVIVEIGDEASKPEPVKAASIQSRL